MANEFTLAGTFKDGQNNVAFVGEYVIFRITSIGTDMEDNVAYPRDSVDFLIDANGDFGGTLWINGDSGTECFYEIRTPDGQRIDVVIPSSVEGNTVRFEDILELYQVDSSTQQSTVLATALAYTDTLAADPSDNASFNSATWLVDLGINPSANDQFLVSTGANTWALEAGNQAQLSLGVQAGSGGGQVGTGSSSTIGGAVGLDSLTTQGGSVGRGTTSGHGFSGGLNATSADGAAVGADAVATDGFAGGDNAKADGTGRVQLGTGVNSTDNTIQFLSSGSITGAQFAKLASVTTPVTTTTYTSLDTDKYILANNASGVTVTLLAAATAADGFELTVKNVNALGVVTVDGNGSETIDGDLTKELTSQYDSFHLVCDGSNWNII